MPEETLYDYEAGYWRIYRDPVHGLCLAVTKTWIVWYEIAIRLNEEEIAAFEAGNLRLLADQADRLRAWPDHFIERLVKDDGPR